MTTDQQIGTAATPTRRRATTFLSKPTMGPSRAAKTKASSDAKPSRPGKASLLAEPRTFPLSPAAIVTELVTLQRIRRFCIKSQSRCDRSIEALIASMMGFRLDADEKDRKALFKRAANHRKTIEAAYTAHAKAGRNEPFAPEIDYPLAHATNAIVNSALARKPWDKERAEKEAEMTRLAELLPVWPWVQRIPGFGAVGLAIVTAEAGIPIGEYRTVSGLWKRLGLAVINGRRQQKMKDPDLAALHGYSPGRRAEIFTVGSVGLFYKQWQGAKDEDGNTPTTSGKPAAIPARATGPYGEVYAARRAHTLPRMEATAHLDPKDPLKWSKGRCKNDALRVMTKALLRDLWVEWRRLDQESPSC